MEPYSVTGNTTSLTNGQGMNDYVTWDMGGEKVFLPTFNKDNTSLETDVTGDAIEGHGGNIYYDGSTKSYEGVQGNHYGDGTHDYFEINPKEQVARFLSRKVDANTITIFYNVLL